jgi:hypothetical protein
MNSSPLSVSTVERAEDFEETGDDVSEKRFKD